MDSQPFWQGFLTMLMRRRSPTTATLDRLQRIPDFPSATPSVGGSVTSDIVEEAIRTLATAPTLSSRTTCFETVHAERAERISWRIDYERPDRFHVTQRYLEDGAAHWDEWITVGGKEYRNPGLWMCSDEPVRTETNQFLDPMSWVTVLRAVRSLPCEGKWKRRTLLTIEEHDLDLTVYAPGFQKAVEADHARIIAWFDVGTRSLLCALLRTPEQELRTVFANIGAPHHLTPPEHLNVENGVVVNNKIYAVPHW